MKFAPGEIAIIWKPTTSQHGSDMSSFHGQECEIISYANGQYKEVFDCDYKISVNEMNYYVLENELRKKPQDENDESHYDGNAVLSWDHPSIVWRPKREVEYEE